MKVKEGVTLSGLQLQMRPVLMAAERVWRELGDEVTITSTTEGVHSAGSLHPYGYAVDLRTRTLSPEAAVHQAASRLRDLLPSGFQVILHSTHIHVEWEDAKTLAPSR